MWPVCCMISFIASFIFCRPKSGSSVWNPVKGDASLSAAAGEGADGKNIPTNMVVKVVDADTAAGLSSAVGSVGLRPPGGCSVL
ncbi:uncharacterized protein V6R79_021807 [Siganus canaliculatus]